MEQNRFSIFIKMVKGLTDNNNFKNRKNKLKQSRLAFIFVKLIQLNTKLIFFSNKQKHSNLSTNKITCNQQASEDPAQCV